MSTFIETFANTFSLDSLNEELNWQGMPSTDDKMIASGAIITTMGTKQNVFRVIHDLYQGVGSKEEIEFMMKQLCTGKPNIASYQCMYRNTNGTYTDKIGRGTRYPVPGKGAKINKIALSLDDELAAKLAAFLKN